MNEDASFWVRIGGDVNGDGRFSIGDVGSRLFEILILPGDAVLYLLFTYAPGIADFLELGRDDFGGTVSISVAVLIWLTAILVAGTTLGKLRELDRRLTARIAACYAETQRLIRILKRRLVTSITFRPRETHSENESLVVDTFELAATETALLRCLSSIDDGAVLTIDEIAAKLDRPQREIKSILQRLVELDLVKPSADSFTNKDGHRIATAGQMYLLGT